MNDNHDFEEEFFEANGNWTNEVDWENYPVIGSCECDACKVAYTFGILSHEADQMFNFQETKQIQPLEQLKWDEDSIVDTLAFIQKLPGGK